MAWARPESGTGIEVDIGRTFSGEDLSDLAPDRIDLPSVEDGIRPGEIDPLEHAVCLGVLSDRGIDLERVLRDLADLTGLDVANELAVQSIDCGALGNGDVSSVDPPEAQRPESVRIADGEKPVVYEDGERICSVELPHRGADRLDGVVVHCHVLAEKLRHQLAVGIREEGPTLLHVLLLQLGEVCYIAVMGDRDGSEIGHHGQGLGVHNAFGPCRGIPYVPHADMPGEVADLILGQSDVHEA